MNKNIENFINNFPVGLNWLLGSISAIPVAILGTWNNDLNTLSCLIVTDFLTGLLKSLIGKSDKSKNGGLTSKMCREGIIKKFCIFIYVALGNWLDCYLNIESTPYIRTMVILSFIISETISIIENLHLITGYKIPVFEKVIDIMRGKLND